MIRVVDHSQGRPARNRLGAVASPGISGAVAALDTVYYSRVAARRLGQPPSPVGQLPHHGSIDDPFDLVDYQSTARS